MKKRRGFTLIELLAVIVILAIIALIAVPVILNIIDKANKSAFKDTAYGIVSAAELYFAEQQLDLNGMGTAKEFSLPSQANTTDGLQLKGEVPEGKVQITKNGDVALLVKNQRYCITKGYNDTEVTLSEDLEHCYMPHTLAALSVEEVECAKDKTEDACDPGTMFTIKVNDNVTKNFYVVDDEGDKVTLIMSENLGTDVAWYEDGDDTTYEETTAQGPLTAINYLDELTDEEWSNIPRRVYTYSGLAHDGETRIYANITRTMRARMITYSEADTIKIANNGLLPPYMYGTYWTSTAYSSGIYGGVWLLNYSVDVTDGTEYAGLGIYFNDGTSFGMRPVIELSK